VSCCSGNIDAAGAKRIVFHVERAFAFSPLSPRLRSAKRLARLPDCAGADGVLLSRPEPNSNDRNSAVIFYFQLDARDAEPQM
jgi:hypothetical protein